MAEPAPIFLSAAFHQPVVRPLNPMSSSTYSPQLQLFPQRHWTPVYSRALHEYRLQKFFSAHAIPHYLPLLKRSSYKTVRSANRTYQYLQERIRPMFPGYIFAALSKDDEALAWRSKSVVRLLHQDADKQDCLLQELLLIRRLELAAQTEKLEVLPELVPGKKVMIAAGPWEGIYGVLQERRKEHHFIVNLHIMGQAIATEIDVSQLQLLEVS